MNIKETEYENYGKCIKISNGVIEAIVTIDCGPRIVSLSLSGQENILYNDLDRHLRIRGEKFDELYGKDSCYKLYGGHRLLLSPEDLPNTYVPDNTPAIYSVTEDGVSFIPPKQENTHMQTGFTILMCEGSADMMVIHHATNLSKDTQTLALWAITMLKPGGFAVIPQNAPSDGDSLLPNRLFALWPYSNMNDPRLHLGHDYITLQQTPKIDEPFKLGTDNLSGWSLYCNNGTSFIKHYVHNSNAVYPDMGISNEHYLCGEYYEMETLSPLYHIAPGDTIRHVENFSLFSTPNINECNFKDEISIQSFLQKLK